MHFEVGNVDGSEDVVVDTFLGYDLIGKIGLFSKSDFKTLFKEEALPVFHARLKYIEIVHEQDGVKFNMRLDGDDSASVDLTFTPQLLKDDNAKKIAMIREVLDFDNEAESSLLRDFLK